MVKARSRNPRKGSQLTYRPVLPFVPMKVSPNPPPFTPFPPVRRVVQLAFSAAKSTNVNVSLSDFLVDKLGLAQYKHAVLYRLRVWSAPPAASTTCSITVAPLGSYAEITDASGADQRASLGFHWNLREPFGSSDVLAVVNSSTGGFLVEVSAAFL